MVCVVRICRFKHTGVHFKRCRHNCNVLLFDEALAFDNKLLHVHARAGVTHLSQNGNFNTTLILAYIDDPLKILSTFLVNAKGIMLIASRDNFATAIEYQPFFTCTK